MPNHVTNVAVFSNLTEQQFNEIAPRWEAGEFSFTDSIPMPKELDFDSCTYTCNSIVTCDLESHEKNGTEPSKELLVAKELMDKTGYCSWYAFRKAVYGTKWDCYDINCNDKIDEPDGSITLHLDFLTAWSTPEEYFRLLSKKFNNLSIKVDYADEDLGNNCGTYYLEKGKFDHEEPSDPYEFAGLLKYGDESWEEIKKEMEGEE